VLCTEAKFRARARQIRAGEPLCRITVSIGDDVHELKDFGEVCHNDPISLAAHSSSYVFYRTLECLHHQILQVVSHLTLHVIVRHYHDVNN
jgi:hypothetical protein